MTDTFKGDATEGTAAKQLLIAKVCKVSLFLLNKSAFAKHAQCHCSLTNQQ